MDQLPYSPFELSTLQTEALEKQRVSHADRVQAQSERKLTHLRCSRVGM